MIESGKEEVVFMLEKSMPAVVNTYRRLFIDEVPTLAVEDVEFRQNSSIHYDETVAHRIGLLPIRTDLKSYNLPDECKCEGEGCAQCQLKMKLKKSGPCTVYAGDLKSTDPKAVVVFPKTPIAKLLEGQDIELETTAVLGNGKSHMKWTPGIAYFKYVPKINIKSVKNADEIVSSCPQNVFESKGGKLSVVKNKFLDCHHCGECEKLSNGAVKLEPTGKDFVVSIESWGQLTCKEAMLKACEIFDNKLETFAKLIK